MNETIYRQGERVLHNDEPATVAYVRFAPPDFQRAHAYSIKLDSRVGDPGYAGTMVKASMLRRMA